MAGLNLDVTNIKPFHSAADSPIDNSIDWSAYQRAIFNYVGAGSGNAIVRAVAGSGKSRTILESMKLVEGSSIFLAFNKAIADELKTKGVNARTFHSLVYGPAMKLVGATSPTMNKMKQLCRENMSRTDFMLYSAFACRVVNLAKQQGVGFLTPDTFDTYQEICNHHDLAPDSDEADLGTGIELTQELLGWSNESKLIDFDDMLYWTVRDKLRLPRFDVVFVDEAQDTNMIQREILRMIMQQGSRLIAVGDEAQAIYGFRGADSNSLSHIEKEFDAVNLPLSISYRCAKSIVQYAQQWVPHIEARPDAPEGLVEDHGSEWETSLFRPDDLVICRKSAPLLQVAFKCIRDNIPVTILGREIGDGLKTLIRKMNTDDLDKLEQKLNSYMMREVRKAQDTDDEARQEAVTDKVGCILFLINGLKEDRRDIESLLAGIDYLFKDKKKCLKLCTIHKSKGLEAERVFWLDRSQCPSVWARRPHQQQEELNLCYVAATRAKSELHFIELG